MATLDMNAFNSLDDARQNYLTQVDAWARIQRSVDPATAAMHALKLAEANAGGGELLHAEAAATGVRLEVLCKRVITAHEEQQATWVCLEIRRTAAKAAIRNALSAAEMRNITHSLIGKDHGH